MKRNALVVSTAALLALFLIAPGARADADHGNKHVHSFEGSCSADGPTHFSPGATYTQQELSLSYVGQGTCTGTLDGRSVSDAPVTMRNDGRSSGSCVHAETIEPGHGSLTFADGTAVLYTFEFNWVVADGVMRFAGERSGTALGHGTFRDPGPPAEGSQCGTPTGITEIRTQITLSTQSPLESKSKPARGGHSG